MVKHSFEEFLDVFVPKVAQKSRQLNKASWLLETTGSSDAADLKAELDAEVRLMYNDRKAYEQLLAWDKDPELKDPLLKRQLNILIRKFKQNIIPQKLLEAIVQKEAFLAQLYANFRPEVEGKTLSENEILGFLKTETNPTRRKKVWEASKAIGVALAPHILELVDLRNEAARAMGYSDYFQMMLELQEVDGRWLKQIFDEIAAKSDAAYSEVIEEIEKQQSALYGVPKNELGPWAWTDPFGQEDPLDRTDLDSLVFGVDISAASRSFYAKMGLDVQPVLQRSDMVERPGKNQHAFCMNIDRGNDVRTLNNVKSTIKWLETVLHELGHAVYDLGFDKTLPWLLREPPHMTPTEAMALLAGRQAYRYEALKELVGYSDAKEPLFKKADRSLQRRQLIFSRWVLVMTFFESELYRDSKQDLNRLWWSAVKKYQKIRMPKDRERKCDWAAKVHIGLAPVYYFSYLLGEMFASAIEEKVVEQTGSRELTSEKAGQFLQQRLFSPGNRMPWSHLVKHVSGKPLSPDAWIEQFARKG
ncbi:MAG TPA: M2 family metallopeptidase [Rhabdochlamydiaceae bacterium]|jgi:peptidyl-dipeptidase A|nr:M2 family metallopeptidase [Rhabdochlamydiaceae bacterium]